MAWRMGAAGPRLLGKQGKRLRLVQLAEHRPPAPALLPQLAGGRGLHMKCPGGIRPIKRPVLWSGGHHTNVTRAEGGGVLLVEANLGQHSGSAGSRAGRAPGCRVVVFLHDPAARLLRAPARFGLAASRMSRRSLGVIVASRRWA